MGLIDLLGLLSIMAWISSTNSNQKDQILPYLWNHHWTHPNFFWILYTVLRLTPKHCQIIILVFRQYGMPFSNFWGSELRHGAVFLTDSAQMTCLLHSRQKPTQSMWKFNNLKWWKYPSLPLWVYIYIYIYIYIYLFRPTYLLISLFISLFRSLSLSVCLSLSLSLSLYIYIYIQTHTHIYLSLFISFDLFYTSIWKCMRWYCKMLFSKLLFFDISINIHIPFVRKTLAVSMTIQ